MTSTSPKSGVVTLLLAFFLGTFGVHRFYVGKTGSGILQLVTLGGLGFWTLYDFIMIAMGKFTDSEGRTLSLSQASTPASGASQQRRAA
jgi:TM2 domain-containing membrane protein YozV